MSASAPDLSSSISSTGHIDGLGRRSLSFDRETGEMLERAHVQPELAAFESLIRERVARLTSFEDERFARPDRVERDAATGELTVLAEFITGSRLSDLLEATADASIVPGVDVALGYLLESLPALSLLHNAGLTHGLIDASRTVLTPDGQFVFLDPSFGSAVERLNLSRLRLWHRFGVASPAGDGAVHFDAAADISQVTLGGVALILGRNLRLDEYPEALPSLLMEVIEVAQIRGTSAFATGLQRFLQRSLPIPGRRPYATADEAVNDVRQLVRREIGVDVCRQAVIDFAAQMDGEIAGDVTDSDPSRDSLSAHRNPAAHSPRVPELDEFLDSFESPDQADAEVSSPAADTLDDDTIETELSFDSLDTESDVEREDYVGRHDRERHDREPQGERENEIYDLPPLDEVMASENILATTASAVHEFPDIDSSPSDVHEETVVEDLADSLKTVETPEETPQEPSHEESVPSESIEEPPVVAAAEPAAKEVEYPPAPIIDAPIAETVEVAAAAVETVVEPQLSVAEPSEVAAAEPEPEAEPEKDSASSRRRKRQQQKSARARKDKLRSTASGQKTPPPPAPTPEPARPANPSGWLVSPQRAAQFEPPVPIHQPAPPPPPPPPVRQAPIPAVPSFVPTPVGAMPQPVYPSQVVTGSTYGTSSAQSPASPGPLAPPTPVQPSPQPSGQVKIKADAPSGFTPRRSAHEDIAPVHVPAERYGTLGLGHGDAIVEEEARSFPWKLAAIAVAVAGIAIFVGRTYLPGRTAVPGEPGAQVEAPAATSPSTAAPPIDVDTPIPPGRGRLVIQTQPPGVKVQLDRKAVGETPLKLDVAPGRHILTFQTTGGEIVKSVRAAVGKTETLDVPVFSGWVAVFAPIVLQVAADGRSIGTTEQSRLMLPPGRHQLTLTNKELGYSAVEQVDIEPGEVKSVNVNPRGTVNLNAVPWAEVWLDGQKLGDTPLAGTPVSLGQREFVFKNPQFGEKKVSATIKAGANSPVTVDFSK
jgi:hypothetical protein